MWSYRPVGHHGSSQYGKNLDAAELLIRDFFLALAVSLLFAQFSLLL